MPLVLSRYAFTEDDWEEVQAFDCGQKDHELEVSNWLKGPKGQDSAITSLSSENPSRVWLYRLEESDNEDAEPGPIVGFGALGTTHWRWTDKKDPFLPITIIIWYGVQKTFKRQPPSHEDKFYSSQILDDLIVIAHETKDERPILGLDVRPENTRAIEIYRQKQFDINLAQYVDKTTNIAYNRMARILDLDVLERMQNEAKKKKK